MNQIQILVVEDDAPVRNLITTTLKSHGYRYLAAVNGQAAIMETASHNPDIILLDLGLPDLDGNDIIQSIRGWTKTPIIVISARSTEEDKARALDLGADDYLTKPFGSIELMARIRTALRHTRTTMENDSIALSGVYTVRGLTVDYKKHRVFMNGTDTGLTPNEYRIVALLGQHAGQVLTYKQIMKEIWGPYASSDNKILRVHMANFRRKIEPNSDEPRYIFTEVGVGYRMADEESNE